MYIYLSIANGGVDDTEIVVHALTYDDKRGVWELSYALGNEEHYCANPDIFALFAAVKAREDTDVGSVDLYNVGFSPTQDRCHELAYVTDFDNEEQEALENMNDLRDSLSPQGYVGFVFIHHQGGETDWWEVK